jgi:uncharacterized membrane protein YkvA (DUF1232 family)
MFQRIKGWARKLKKQVFTLYYAYKDERVAWPAKIFIACLVAYAFSPIDLIPDFIPILGYLDDLIIVPLGVLLALKMVPDDVLEDSTNKAEELLKQGKQKNWITGTIIIIVWVLVVIWLLSYVSKYYF